MTPGGKIERLEVPRDREGEFVTQLLERYKRMIGDVEVALFEMHLCGISLRKIAGVTEALSKVRIGKDAVSRIASRLEEQQNEWRERSLGKNEYLTLDATYVKVRWGARVTSMALLDRAAHAGQRAVGDAILAARVMAFASARTPVMFSSSVAGRTVRECDMSNLEDLPGLFGCQLAVSFHRKLGRSTRAGQVHFKQPE